ncbi:MAG: hypothetical protein J0H66_07455 [Solirubrobacterales bacterium]|nr:hypothetical protein [Solirubrobacterales bacterium]OJU93217.1 MAG: hypothetical protein BGO23_11000 [Solirubrobacterales bacterium 67-14]
MTDDPQNAPEDPNGPPELTDEERAMLEAQMKEIRVEDLLTQTVASVLNLSARRIVKEDEVDLDQARIGIEAVRAIVALLPAEVGQAIAEPLSQVQLLYAQKSGEAGGEPGTGGASGAGGDGAPQGGDGPQQPPSAGQGPSKLWTPGGN